MAGPVITPRAALAPIAAVPIEATAASVAAAVATIAIEAAPTAVPAAVAVGAPVTPEATPAIVVAVPWRWRRQRPLRGGLALRGSATELGSWRGQDPGGLRAHPQDATAARGQDLEVEIVEADPERLAREPQGLFDTLAGDFAVCV